MVSGLSGWVGNAVCWSLAVALSRLIATCDEVIDRLAYSVRLTVPGRPHAETRRMPPDVVDRYEVDTRGLGTVDRDELDLTAIVTLTELGFGMVRIAARRPEDDNAVS